MIAALALYLLDALVVGQGGLALIGGAIVLVVTVIGALVGREGGKVVALKLVLPVVMVGCVWGTVRVNSHIARSGAERIIAACEAYKWETGRYPDALEELVPRHLEDVPVAKYTLMFNRYRYISSDGTHLLMWTDIAPFGRPTYNLEEGRWGYLD